MPEEEEFANYAIVEVNQLGAPYQELSIQAQHAPPSLSLCLSFSLIPCTGNWFARTSASHSDRHAGRQTEKSLYLQKLWLVCYLIILMKNSGEPRSHSATISVCMFEQGVHGTCERIFKIRLANSRERERKCAKFNRKFNIRLMCPSSKSLTSA